MTPRGENDASVFQTHIVAFVDLLGFRAAIKQADRSAEILDILKALASFNGEFSAESSRSTEGFQEFQVNSAISAFSDNIVISYNLAEMEKHGIGDLMCLHFIQDLVAFIAWSALKVRLLVRGGVAVGDLYHAGGVVYGPALIDAYDVERTVAVYPRIAISDSIKNYKDFDIEVKNLLCDRDGVYHLNYWPNFLYRMTPSRQVDPRIKPWLAEVRNIVEQERSALSDPKASAAWTWFRTQLEEQARRLPPGAVERE